MASAQMMKEYAEVGKTLGVKDADLMDFVQEQLKAAQVAARAERQAERECRRAESEAELALVAKKAEAEQRTREAELMLVAKKAEVELDLIKRKRDEEIRTVAERLDLERRTAVEEHQRKLELEAAGQERRGARHDSATSEGEEERPRFSTRAPRTKMQNFSEGRDDIDAYLQRFERFAELCKWERNDWAMHLSVLLSGKALEVYARLSVLEA